LQSQQFGQGRRRSRLTRRHIELPSTPIVVLSTSKGDS